MNESIIAKSQNLRNTIDVLRFSLTYLDNEIREAERICTRANLLPLHSEIAMLEREFDEWEQKFNQLLTSL